MQKDTSGAPSAPDPSSNSQFPILNSLFPKRDICERTFAFATQIVLLSRTIEKRSGVNRALCNQLIRSGTSIGANVEEAQSGQSRADFVSKMQIACKEARETHYWLRLLASAQIIPESDLTPLVQEANEIVAILTAIVKRTKENSK